MIDLDREMRTLVEERARRTPSLPDATPILHRTHRRQLLVLLTALVVAAAAVGVVVGVSSVVGDVGREVPADDAASFPRASANMIAHADGSIAAYNRGDPDGSIRMAGHGFTSFERGGFHRFDPVAVRLDGAWTLREIVRADHVRRTGPVMRIATSRAGEDGAEWDSTTVLFLVRADGQDQIWIQRWESIWGETLTRMWVIAPTDG
jgi:hypothetical protein